MLDYGRYATGRSLRQLLLEAGVVIADEARGWDKGRRAFSCGSCCAVHRSLVPRQRLQVGGNELDGRCATGRSLRQLLRKAEL